MELYSYSQITDTFRAPPSKRNFVLVLSLISIGIYTCWVISDTVYISYQFRDPFPLRQPRFTEETDDTCILPKFTVFDPEIMEHYAAPTICNSTTKELTVLYQTKLIPTEPHKYDCMGRCHTFKSKNDTHKGPWYHTNQSYSFPCDIIESRCFPKEDNVTQPVYFSMHTQVVEIAERKPKFKVSGKKYDVYFIVVDSQAHSQMFRNLDQTSRFLLEDMGAISFPYMNRIGQNSRENGFAWMYGKITERVDRLRYSLPSLEVEPQWNNSCFRKLDNETMIISEFRDHGYMFIPFKPSVPIHMRSTEDNDQERYQKTILVNTSGAEIHDVHFGIQWPYAMHYEYSKPLIQSLKKDRCLHRHQHALDYLGQFVDSYEDKPKMAFVWLSHVGHNSEWGSRDADPHLLELFRRHKKTFDNSFVFLAGDHGLRFTNVVKTKIGSLDVNNPALFMTLPKELRNNSELMETLKENAGELQTHYDTRATLLDILKFQPSVGFTDRSLKTVDGELGHSLLRQQLKPRTCRNLPIPPPYCICEKQMKEDILTKQPVKAVTIGKQALNTINRRLLDNNIDNECRKWVFQHTQKLIQYSATPKIEYEGIILASTNRTSFLAEFRVYLSGTDETSLAILSLDRVDPFKMSGDCVSRAFQSICDCY